MEITTSINNSCTVKLTKYGKEILKEYYKGLFFDNISIEKMTEGDLLITELWNLFQIFGKETYMGNNNICFVENKIEIELDD